MSKGPKVGFLTGRLLLGYGVDLVVHQYATLLGAANYDAVVYCLGCDTSVERSYDVVNLLAVHGGTDISPVDIPRYAAHLNSLDVDIWIVNTSPFYEFIPFLKRPAISIEYGSPPSKFFPSEIGRLLDTSAAYRLSRVYPRLRPEDRILCISRSIQDWLPPDVRESSDVVYLGCDHYPKAEPPLASDFRLALGLDDGPVILWVGRVQLVEDEQPYKGFPAFIEMARRARGAEPGLQFLVVGRGGEAEAAFLRSEAIAYRLNLPASEMGAAYAASDVLLSTTAWEGFNLPLLEAQYQGTPALAYAQGPHPEVLQDGRTGVLVGSPGDMLDSLLSLSGDAERRARLSREAERFAARFSWSRSVSGLERAITRSLDLAGAKPARPTGRLAGWTFPVEYAYQRFGLARALKRVPAFLARRLGRLVRGAGPG